MIESEVHRQVSAQFQANAANYVNSPTHSDEASLQTLVALVQPAGTERMLDVATGTGHTAIAFAPHVRSVVAYDLTPAMLREAEREASARQLTNVTTCQGAAEAMDFGKDAFDLVTVRTAPHHFADVGAFLKESFRVLRPGGKLLMVDTTVPEEAAVAAEINRLEKLRDPSHGQNLSPSEWRTQISAAGFEFVAVQEGWHAGGKKMELMQWLDRSSTPPPARTPVIAAFTTPSDALRQALAIETAEGSVWFSLPELTVLAIKPGYAMPKPIL